MSKLSFKTFCIEYYAEHTKQSSEKVYEILELLSRHAGQIFDRERIYEALWGCEAEGSSAVVAEHIKRLRAKLAAAGAREHIETKWGMGYRWIR